VDVEHIRSKINELIVLEQEDEQSIFQLPNILLFQQLFLMEYIQYNDLDIPKECIQFDTRQHNNQSLFFLLERIQFFEQLRIQ